jgi:hypothetical protein
MFEAYAGYLIAELGFLKRHADWDIRWRNAIRENQTGHPSPFWLHRGSSGNLIHHAYHIAQFEEATNLRVNDMGFILEFGGGYGSMCRLLRNLHFTGKYVIFDLPAFSALQRYFLGSVGLTVHSFESFKSAGSGVLCISDLRQLNEILSNHFDPTRSMFIATWSLSEAPLGTRNQIMPLMQPFHSFLIAYQEHFGEMANVGFFDAWKKTLPNIMWRDRVIPHLSPSRYLVGAMSSPGKGTG